jgi:hypothetical protein
MIPKKLSPQSVIERGFLLFYGAVRGYLILRIMYINPLNISRLIPHVMFKAISETTA